MQGQPQVLRGHRLLGTLFCPHQDCPQGNGASWCNGVCEWSTNSSSCVPMDMTLTTTMASNVLCGGHYAASCADCPQGNGASWCNGVCVWVSDSCVPITTTTTRTITTATMTMTMTSTTNTTVTETMTTTLAGLGDGTSKARHLAPVGLLACIFVS